jgi:5-methylcytosine-specific restriction endonuclease McrA
VTYNTKPRRSLSRKQRAELLLMHNCFCAWCGMLIVDNDWQDDHEVPREMGGSDDLSNRRPLHTACHLEKTALDRKVIAKSNSVRRRHGPVEVRTKPKRKFPSRGFQKGHKPIQSRPFPKRGRKNERPDATG